MYIETFPLLFKVSYYCFFLKINLLLIWIHNFLPLLDTAYFIFVLQLLQTILHSSYISYYFFNLCIHKIASNFSLFLHDSSIFFLPATKDSYFIFFLQSAYSQYWSIFLFFTTRSPIISSINILVTHPNLSFSFQDFPSFYHSSIRMLVILIESFLPLLEAPYFIVLL